MKMDFQKVACISEDPNLFYSEDPYHQRAAKNICYGCPIIGRCLADAMINQEEYGIWGGHTPEERESYKSHWTQLKKNELPLLKKLYKRHSMAAKYENRLAKCMIARRVITPILPRYNDYVEVLEMVIKNPEMTTENIGKRLGWSRTWVTVALQEAWKIAS